MISAIAITVLVIACVILFYAAFEYYCEAEDLRRENRELEIALTNEQKTLLAFHRAVRQTAGEK